MKKEESVTSQPRRNKMKEEIADNILEARAYKLGFEAGSQQTAREMYSDFDSAIDGAVDEWDKLPAMDEENAVCLVVNKIRNTLQDSIKKNYNKRPLTSMKKLSQMQEEARKDFDKKFGNNPLLQQSNTKQLFNVNGIVMPFIDSLISKVAHDVSETMIVEEMQETPTVPNLWNACVSEQRSRQKKLMGNQEEK